MTNSKKLSFALLLALGLQFVAQGYTVDALTHETQCIVKFTQDLRNQNSTQAQTVAQWLDNKVMDQSATEDNDIIIMAHIVNNPALTTDSKITIFSQTMEKEAKEQRNQKIKKYAKIACGTVVVGILGVVALVAIDNSNTTVFNPGGGVQLRVNTSQWSNQWSNIFRP